MYDIPEDCLLTYDHEYLDLHSNSTDFEDSRILRVAPKSGNHSLFNKKKVFKKSSKDRSSENVLYNGQMTKSSSKVLYETETIYNDTDKESEVYKSYKNRKTQILHSQNQIEAKSSKRHKIIPSISSIFKKSSNEITSRSVIKQSKAENSSQTCRASCESRTGNVSRRQQYYAIQPVYGVERNIFARASPYKQPKKNRGPIPSQKTSRDEYYNTIYSLTSSSEAEHQLHHIIETKSNWTKQIDNDMTKRFKDTNLPRRNQKDQQLLNNSAKRRRKFPFQVYQNPIQSITGLRKTCDVSSSTSAVPSTCSGFWDYLFNKINNKYQKVQVYKSCKCCANDKLLNNSPCCNVSCNSRLQLSPQVKCRCKVPGSTNQASTETQQTPYSATMTPPSAKLHIPPKSQRQNISADVNQPAAQKPETPPEIYGNKTSCQIPHNDLATALNEKYNAEILCIHNPPCIVINGCLNLPPIASNNQPRTTPMWAVTECIKPSYQKISRSKRSKKKIKDNKEDMFGKTSGNEVVEQSSQYRNQEFILQEHDPIKMERNDQSCQYLAQTVDQGQLTELMTEEKNIQSHCHHEPPCEVKRKCQKPKYGPMLDSSCFHVPICDNVPVCMLSSNETFQIKRSCCHKPKCIEVPKCSVDYFVMNAKGETGTQVRSKSRMVCRHDPPCIMISRCLAQMCAEGYTPRDAIPSCVHRPRCEMIPACCRKSAKEMVSVCSQHPNSCRIV